MMKKITVTLLFHMLIYILQVQAQSLPLPVGESILLSGNFAELRASHLHSGIDFRTGGKEGSPVRCVQDGVLARVAVSPYGYGNALYIEHPDGTTSVYAHLQKFNPELSTMTRSTQYRKKSFSIDINVKDKGIKFKQGDIIGYSGNSGSSGGPHLHFEIRRTATQTPLNPLLFYSIVDTIAPMIHSIECFGIDNYGAAWEMPALSKRQETGLDTCFVPYERAGLASHIVDQMNNSTNKLGAYTIHLKVDGREFYKLKMDSSSFYQKSFVNDLKVDHYYSKGKTVYKFFGNYQNKVYGISNRTAGFIRLDTARAKEIELVVTDINGNVSTRKLWLKRAENLKTPQCSYLDRLKAHTIGDSTINVHLPKGALYQTEVYHYRSKYDSLKQRNEYVFSNIRIPLLKKGQVTLKGKFPKSAVLCQLSSKNNLLPLTTKWDSTSLSASISSLGKYSWRLDTVAPSLVDRGISKWGTWRFSISDDFSGLRSYQALVNGKWTLYSYDPKTRAFYISINEPTFVIGKNHLVITLIDGVGNKTRKEFYYDKLK